jgi:hypothetical protein
MITYNRNEPRSSDSLRWIELIRWYELGVRGRDFFYDKLVARLELDWVVMDERIK